MTTRVAARPNVSEWLAPPIDTYCDVGYNMDKYSYSFMEGPNEDYPNDD
jgi:hypothetical protein